MPKLTKRLIDRAKPEPGKDLTLMDSALRGFGLRVRGETKTYFIRYRSSGRHRRFNIGRHGELTPQQARLLAQKKLAAIADGADPAAIRADGKEAPTMADLCERYMNDYAKPRKKPLSVADDKGQIDNYVLPKFGKIQVAAISHKDIVRFHNSLAKIPYRANRLIALLHKMFSLAEAWGMRPQNSNPCQGIEKYKETGRTRYLSEIELSRLGKTLRECNESIYVVSAIQLILLTGCRKNEVLNLKWKHFDTDNNLIIFPDSKSGYKTLPLTTAVREVLEKVPTMPGNPYVICGALPGQCLKNLDKPWRRVRKLAKLQDVRLHDLRHSHGSFGAGQGLSAPIIAKLLGHHQVRTTEGYMHLANDPVRAAGEQVSQGLKAALDREPIKAEVIPLTGQRAK